MVHERPLVAITTRSMDGGLLAARYEVVKAVIDAGLVPLVVCAGMYRTVHELFALGVAGVVLPGGSDVSPSLYGQEVGVTTEASDLARDNFEVQVIRAARERELPILGLCRGAQIVAVASGGQLIQEVTTVSTALQHGKKDATYADLSEPSAIHAVSLIPHTRASTVLNPVLLGQTLNVRSMHHQVVNPASLPKDLRVTGTAPDGTAAILEDTADNIFFQDHVEWGSTRQDWYWRLLSQLIFFDFAERVEQSNLA